MDLVMQAIGFGASAWLLWWLVSWLGARTAGESNTIWDHGKELLVSLLVFALLFVMAVWLEESCSVRIAGSPRFWDDSAPER